jgi:decaprenylphospho-beta-D-ribofuranose 2-oxidase
MTEASITKEIHGWGRFPVATSQVFRPEKRSALGEILQDGLLSNVVPRGLGRSYGDAAINGAQGGVVDVTRLNRFLSFDESTGVLTAEAGVSLAEIIETFLPRGFFPPVTPGTKFVTLGGAVASDVHGKNHEVDGTITTFIDRFTLLVPSGEVLTCSRSEHSDVFWATVGGMGLTGFILTVTLRLRRIETSYQVVDYLQLPNLDAAFKAFEAGHSQRYSVAWIDCLGTGKSLGRSVLMLGDDATPDQVKKAGKTDLLPVCHQLKRKAAIPVDFPSWVLNPLSIRAFNEAFYLKNRTTHGKLVDYDTYYYPLDFVNGWSRMYGGRGFLQYQFVLPPETAYEGLTRILGELAKHGAASFLAVLKRFGAENEGLLSFPKPGYTLALDIPWREGLVEMLQRLDEVVLKYKGRTYLAKDAVLKPEMIRAMYPRLAEFQAIRNRLDPNNRLSSALGRRTGLVPDAGDRP